MLVSCLLAVMKHLMEHLKEEKIISARSVRGHGGGEGVVVGSQSHGNCRQKAEREMNAQVNRCLAT